MHVYLSHPTGNQNSRQLAIALATRGHLEEFATALAIPPALTRCRLLPPYIRFELERRSFPTHKQMRSLAAVSEITRLARSRITRETTGRRSDVDDLYLCVDRRAAERIRRCTPTHVYAYEDGALESLRAGRAVGAKTVYELPIGHWKAHRALCERERELNPDWAHTWALADEPADKIARKDDEIAAANLVVVPSEFVKSTLVDVGVQESKIAVVPYGCPAPQRSEVDDTIGTSPLRILFVGSLSQRKGLSDLVSATSNFGGHVHVTVIGSGPGREMLPSRWTVINTLPHAKVLDQMRRHDVFVFPTRFEGRSLAVAEAISCGLILITTANSGAADLVQEGVNGWITGVGDVAAISEKLDLLLRQRALVPRMKVASRRIAGENSWPRYHKAVISRLSLMDAA